MLTNGPAVEDAPLIARSHTRGQAPAGDRICLTYEARYLRRRRVTTEAGRAVLIDLPEPVDLRDGDCLTLEDGGIVAIVADLEPLTEVRGHLVRLAWHIGNRHTPCEIREDRLLILRDHVLEDMLRGLGAGIEHVVDRFQPEGGAYGHGRTHGHSHSHDPHADPNAHIAHRHD